MSAALRCFYESEDYHSFLVNVISLDCDTDTLGAIGGGVAEEFYKKTFDNADEIIKKVSYRRIVGDLQAINNHNRVGKAADQIDRLPFAIQRFTSSTSLY